MAEPIRCRLAVLKTYLFMASLAVALLCLGCEDTERSSYQKGMALMQAQDYPAALEKFDYSLQMNPEAKGALYRKAYCLYKLDRHADALPLFEQFLQRTDNNEWTAPFSDERKDAAFFRDKCKQALGQEVPQDPASIPPPPMGE